MNKPSLRRGDQSSTRRTRRALFSVGAVSNARVHSQSEVLPSPRCHVIVLDAVSRRQCVRYGMETYASTPQGSQGSGPPIFDLQGSINVLDPRNNSRVRCTIFVNIIDFVVIAVIEQVYSTFNFCLLKIQEICPLKRFIFTYKCTKMRLVAGLRPNPLGSLQRSPETPYGVPLSSRSGTSVPRRPSHHIL